MSDPLVETRDDRGVVTLTMSRPDKRNAMDPALMGALEDAAARLAEDAAARVVVLAAEGKAFSAGADLGWMREQLDADRETRVREAMRLARMFRALDALPKPLIGRVHGDAFGGGLGLVSVCDVAVGAEGARFGFTETRLGLIPGTISPYVIARIGAGPARRVFMSARLFDAREALRLDLLGSVVAGDDLDAAVEAEVAPYLSASPEAVAAAKALARSLGPPLDDAAIARSVEHLADAWETPDAREGVSAFLDKRKPRWLV